MGPTPPNAVVGKQPPCQHRKIFCNTDGMHLADDVPRQNQQSGIREMLRKIATATAGILTLFAAATAHAEDKPTWTGPFGGTFNANFAFVTDYSYRGLSQTQRGVAGQMGFGYETPAVSEKVPLTGYLQAWGSNVNFPNTGASFEVDTIAGARYKALGDKLLVDASFMRYNYPGAAQNTFFDFNEYGLLVSYDFDVVALTAGSTTAPTSSATPVSAGTSSSWPPCRCRSSS